MREPKLMIFSGLVAYKTSFQVILHQFFDIMKINMLFSALKLKFTYCNLACLLMAQFQRRKNYTLP